LNVRFKASFARDLRALKDKALLERIKELIANVEAAQSLAEVSNLKKLRGGGGYYRGRIGDYRVGLATEEEVVVFVRVLHRREVYRYFP
jgi:mRNA interferase RelE/StbE